MKSLARRILEESRKSRYNINEDTYSQVEMLKKIKSKLTPKEADEVFYLNKEEYINKDTRFLDIETENGEPIGFVMLEDCNDNKANCLNTVIAVTPESRGKGLAEKMFRKAARFFVSSNYEQLIWRVRNTNTPSINLAKKFGFTYGWQATDNEDYDIYLVTNPSRFKY